MKLIFLLMLVPFLSFAEEDMVLDKKTGHLVPRYVAELKAFKGKVLKQRPGGKAFEVTAGTRFFKDERLITEPKSYAKLLVVDDTEMTIGPSSEINFEKFNFMNKKERNIVYELVRGQMKGHVVNKAQDGDVVIKTKNAVLGVRGTEIMVNHRTLNNLEVSEFALASGKAEVDNLIKQIKHELEQGDRVVIVADPASKANATVTNKLGEDEIKFVKEDEEGFMPFFDIKDIKLVQADAAPADSGDSGERLEKKQEGSFQNLERLNEKLKKSHSH